MTDLDTLDEGVEEDATPGAEDDFGLWEEELVEGAEEEDPDELEHKINTSERARISLPEIIIVLMLSIFTEAVEWLGDAANILPVIGQAIWLFTSMYGLIISAILFMWSIFRGMYNGKRTVLKLAAMIGGPLLDAFTAGLFPETLTLAAAIFLHNRLEQKDIDHASGLLNKASKKL